MQDSLKDALELVAMGFSHRLAEYGPTSKGVMWKSEEGQIERFELLCRAFEGIDQDQAYSINDLGCGYGAFLDYLVEKQPIKISQFYGYDLSADMVEAAQANFLDHPTAYFEQAISAQHPADFSFVSGTFNLMATETEENWSAFIKVSLLDLFQKTNIAMAFNLLTANRKHQEWFYYADPVEFHTFCRTQLSEKTELIYHKDEAEFTLLVWKG